MKVIIAGSRQITNAALVEQAMASFIGLYGFPTEIVSGGCRGPDELGEAWAREHQIPIKVFTANWKLYGKAAGPLRNEKMSHYADALLACWDKKSRGTRHIIDYMKSLGKTVLVRAVE